MSLSSASLSALLAALLGPALPLALQDAPDPRPAQAGEPALPKSGVDLTFMANAGFFLQSADHSILIDCFLRQSTNVFAALPTEVYKNLVNARPPFDGPIFVFVSHNHPDHVQMRSLEKFLVNNEKARLAASPQVVSALRGEAKEFPSFAERVASIPTRAGVAREFVQDDLHVTVMELKHVGAEDSELVNFGHLITMGGMKILHVGDASPTSENFAAFDFASEKLDVLLFPYWYLGTEEGRKILEKQIPARYQIACHVPEKEWENVNTLIHEKFPSMILFKESLEKRSFLPAEPGASK